MILCITWYCIYLHHMFKKLIILWIACFFLGSSIVLPLGDFALLRDIPQMYHNYEKIATGKDVGITDFVGDYLLHGKELLGHNKRDKPQTSSNNVQFQHSPNPLTILLFVRISAIPQLLQVLSKPPFFNNIAPTSDYQNTLLRPPLA